LFDDDDDDDDDDNNNASQLFSCRRPHSCLDQFIMTADFTCVG
jgi:hypothetical protein